MSTRIILLTVIILLAVVWPAQAQSPPVSLSAATGLTFAGEKLTLGITGSYQPFADFPLAADIGWRDPVWWGGLSLPVPWLVELTGAKLVDSFAAILDPFAVGMFVARDGHKPFDGGVYAKVTAFSTGF